MTHAAGARLLAMPKSVLYAEILSFEPRLELGTDLEGSISLLIWLWWVWASSEGGDVSVEPERLVRLS